MTNTPNESIAAHYATRNAFLDDISARIDARTDDPKSAHDMPNLIRCMTAMRDLASYIANSAAHKLESIDKYPDFYPAFLDDDSDYLPAALDMMNDLMIALSSDDPDIAADALIDRIQNDDMMISCPDIRYSELPLDAPHDLPIIDPYA